MPSHLETLDNLKKNRPPSEAEIQEALTKKDSSGNTLAHHAAQTKRLSDIPEHLLTEPILCLNNNAQESPASICITNHCLKQIPKHLLRESLLKTPHGEQKKTILQLLILTGQLDFIDKAAITPTCVDTIDANQNTPLHDAAYLQCLETLSHTLTPQRLLQQNAKNQCPAHFAAQTQTLRHIPRKLLTPELLSVKTNLGNSVAHWAAKHQCLQQIPLPTLKKTLALCNEKGQSVAHFAARFGTLKDIPKELLTKTILLQETKEKQSVLLWAAASGHLTQIPSGKIDLATLQSLTKTFPESSQAWLEEQITQEKKRQTLKASLTRCNHDWI